MALRHSFNPIKKKPAAQPSGDMPPPRPQSQAPQRPVAHSAGNTTDTPSPPSSGRRHFTPRNPSRQTIAVSVHRTTPRGHPKGRSDAGEAREALLGGDPPLVVRVGPDQGPAQFLFTHAVDPVKHGALIDAACAEWFASTNEDDIQEGAAFLDAAIDALGAPALSQALLERHGLRLLEHCPPPWAEGRFAAIAATTEALSHRLTPHTPPALRQLVLALHPRARVAEQLRELDTTVQALERSAAPLPWDEAARLVRRLNDLIAAALDQKNDAMVRTAVDLAQRVANCSAPCGEQNNPLVQAMVTFTIQQLPAGVGGSVTRRVNDWLSLDLALHPGPGEPTLIGLRFRPEAIGQALDTARQALRHWIHEQQTGGGAQALPWPDLVRLVEQLAPALHWQPSPADWLGLCLDEALGRLNLQPLLAHVAGLDDGAPADAFAVYALLERYGAPDVTPEQRVELLRDLLPLLPRPSDDPRLHGAYRRMIDALPESEEPIAKEKNALREQHDGLLQPPRVRGSSPSAFVNQLIKVQGTRPARPGPLPPPATVDQDAERAYARLFLDKPVLGRDALGPGARFLVLQRDGLAQRMPAIQGLCDAWFHMGQQQQAIALLDAVLPALDDRQAQCALLAAHAAALATAPASAWAGGKGANLLALIHALGISPWFLPNSPGHLGPATRLALLKPLAAHQPLAAIGLIAAELSHRLRQAPAEPLPPADGKHFIELLRLLLHLGVEQGDPDMLKRTIAWARALAQACGPRPSGGVARLQARLNVLGQDAHEALTQMHLAWLSGWLALEWKDGSGLQPRTLSGARLRHQGGTLQIPEDRAAALSAFIEFIDAQLAHPKGLPWGSLVQLTATACAALGRTVPAARWWSWCVAEALRTGNTQPLQYQLEHHQSIDSPDSPLFKDVLTVCGDPQASGADRAALLGLACAQLLPPERPRVIDPGHNADPPSIDETHFLFTAEEAKYLKAQAALFHHRQPHARNRDEWWAKVRLLGQTLLPPGDHNQAIVRLAVMDWLHAQARLANGLSLASIEALARTLPWSLEACEWLDLRLQGARHKGQPQALIEWLAGPPPSELAFLDKELFQDILDLAQTAPLLSPNDRWRLLNAAQAALLRERRGDVALQCAYADALAPLRSPRKSDPYSRARRTLFDGSSAPIAPPDDGPSPVFQLQRPALGPNEVEALLTVCDAWAKASQWQKLRALLDAVLGGTLDRALHRRLLMRYADPLANLMPNAAQQAQWKGILAAITGLAQGGWATAGHTDEVDATTRGVLSRLVLGIDWAVYAHIELSGIEHQIEHLPGAALLHDTGHTLLNQLSRLSMAAIGKDDAPLAQRALRIARALAQRLDRCGEDPRRQALQAPLKALMNQASQAWFNKTRSALQPWLTLERHPNATSHQPALAIAWNHSTEQAATREVKARAWQALLTWVRIELENPHGLDWPALQDTIETIERAWWGQGKALGDREWLALCLMDAMRTGSLSALDRRLAMLSGTALDAAMLDKLLALANELRFPPAGRAALLKHLLKHLSAQPAGNPLHARFLLTLLTRCEPDAADALLATYRHRHPQMPRFVELAEFVAWLDKAANRSSEQAWQALAGIPSPDVGVDWSGWRQLCQALATRLAARIQDVQSIGLASPRLRAFQQDFNDRIVLVLMRLSTSPDANAATCVQRQGELLSDLVQALPPEWREACLRQLDEACTRHIDKARQPRPGHATPTPARLLALREAVRALGGH